jgi:hypothetical protein
MQIQGNQFETEKGKVLLNRYDRLYIREKLLG